jgi:glycosyltransferase involved in cell wall biosynthesis
VKHAKVGVFCGIRTESGDEDGIPNAILEYDALRVPIVSTDAGSTGDFIDDGKTGLSVPQKDPHTLADKIEILIFDDALGRKLTDNAYLKLSQDFDLNKNVINLERLLL